MNFLLMASNFAAKKHRDQRRKDDIQSPYINHPIAVANVLANEAGVTNENLLIAALLHDTIEDTETSGDEIKSVFGEAVLKLVMEVTDDKSLEKADRKRLQVESAPKKSELARQLKIADKICNIRDITADSPAGWNQQRKSEYLDWGQAVVAGCAGVNLELDQLIASEIQKARTRIEG